jgi:hypothetical protein
LAFGRLFGEVQQPTKRQGQLAIFLSGAPGRYGGWWCKARRSVCRAASGRLDFNYDPAMDQEAWDKMRAEENKAWASVQRFLCVCAVAVLLMGVAALTVGAAAVLAVVALVVLYAAVEFPLIWRHGGRADRLR